MILSRVLFAVLTATVMLAFTAALAQANRSVEIRGGERGITASSRLTLNGTELRVSTRIECDMTLLRTISRIIPKTTGALFGRVTGVAIDLTTCIVGEGVAGFRRFNVLQERGRVAPSSRIGNVTQFDVSRAPAPLWKLVYDSFQGVLPEISGINFHISGTQFEVEAAVNCLYRGEAFGLISIARKAVTEASAVLARTRLPRDSGSIFCPFAEVTFAGRFRVAPALTIELL